MSDPDLEAGWIDENLHAEFPQLALAYLTLDVVPGRSPRAVRERLRGLSSRFRGATAVAMRQEPVPSAYRVFYRHIGLDPDRTRTPVEGAALQRLLHGEFRARNSVDDALTIALVETGVPIWGLDSERVEEPLGLRTAHAGERLGNGADAPPLTGGELVVADRTAPLGVLFGELAPGHGVGRDTRRMTIYAVRVPGVPGVHVEEALWTCVEVLAAT